MPTYDVGVLIAVYNLTLRWDRAPAYPRVLDELLPAACHVMEKYATPARPITAG
jgi:hypothetical protein